MLQPYAATNSLNLSIWQEPKFLIQMDHFFGSTKYVEKNEKNNDNNNNNNNNCQKYVIACALAETEDHINSFQVEFPSLYHPKTSENLWFLIYFYV